MLDYQHLRMLCGLLYTNMVSTDETNWWFER